MRTLCGFVVVAVMLASWPGIAHAQDQPAAPAEGAAKAEQKPAVKEGEKAAQPEAAEAPKEKEAAKVSEPAAAPAEQKPAVKEGEKAAQPEAAEAASTAPFIGNKGSKKVHRADCSWGIKTSPGKRIYFNTYDEAEKAGYAPCRTCKPQLTASAGAAAAGASKISAPASAEGEFCASAKGKSFHRASCEWAKKISAANLVKYKTREEAVAAGKKPCSTCMP